MRRGEQISLLEKIVIILIGGISISLILYNPKRNCEEETLKDYLPLQQEIYGTEGNGDLLSGSLFYLEK